MKFTVCHAVQNPPVDAQISRFLGHFDSDVRLLVRDDDILANYALRCRLRLRGQRNAEDKNGSISSHFTTIRCFDRIAAPEGTELRLEPSSAHKDPEEIQMNLSRRTMLKAALGMPAFSALLNFRVIAAPFTGQVKITKIKTMGLDNLADGCHSDRD